MVVAAAIEWPPSDHGLSSPRARRCTSGSAASILRPTSCRMRATTSTSPQRRIGLIAAPEVSALPRPVLGFAGNFLASKVDFDLLEQVAAALPRCDAAADRAGRSRTGPALERLAQLAERPLAGAEAVRRLASVRRRVRRRADPLRIERLHAKLLSAEALRVPRRRQAGRRKRPSRARRDGAGRRARRRRNGLRGRRSSRRSLATARPTRLRRRQLAAREQLGGEDGDGCSSSSSRELEAPGARLSRDAHPRRERHVVSRAERRGPSGDRGRPEARRARPRGDGARAAARRPAHRRARGLAHGSPRDQARRSCP